MGSDSDLTVMQAAGRYLQEFGIEFELTVVSAHRTPLRMIEYASQASARGLKVIIAGAGVLHICPEWLHQLLRYLLLVFL